MIEKTLITKNMPQKVDRINIKKKCWKQNFVNEER